MMHGLTCEFPEMDGQADALTAAAEPQLACSWFCFPPRRFLCTYGRSKVYTCYNYQY